MRGKYLSPMANEMTGMVESASQLTKSLPPGFGRFSHSLEIEEINC